MQMQISNIITGANPRRFFDPSEMEELIESVRAKGVIQPILVRPIGDKHQIIAGERRFRAASAVGLTEIPVLVKEMTDQEADEAALIENVLRADMSPAEEAQAAARVLGTCAGNRDEAAKRLGWSRSTLDKRLALMNCSNKVRDALTERKITLGHAELLAAVTKEVQDGVLNNLLNAPALPNVAQLKANLEQRVQPLDVAIFDKTGCAGCPHNSGTQQALFAEAISGSNCTNKSCYEGKTTEALNLKAESLKDEYPVIKIVQPGENFVLLSLKAEGATGVGAEQAMACRGCANFGAAVSAIPGSIGNVYKGQCFDPTCNAQKVAARIAAETTAAKEEAKKSATPVAKEKAEAKPKGTGDAKAEPKAPIKVETSQRVKEYRVKVWRKAYQVEAQADSDRNTTLLLALAMTNKLGSVSDSLLRKVFNHMTGADVPLHRTGEVGKAVASADAATRALMVTGIAASVSESIEEQTLKELLSFMSVDLGNHWKMNEEYLALLTKSEIDVVADEIGLKAAMGDKFSKAMAGKKDEIIKALLAAEGFDFTGKVPKHLAYVQV